MIEATVRDYVSITSEDDYSVIMRGRVWLIYHEVGTAVADAVDEDETDVEELAKQIRKGSHKIAKALVNARANRFGGEWHKEPDQC